MLDRINSRLKEDGIRARVEQRGQRLCLRATVPLKDGIGSKQQRLNLDTTDLVQADLKARELGQQIRNKTFSWDQWEDPESTTITCNEKPVGHVRDQSKSESICESGQRRILVHSKVH